MRSIWFAPLPPISRSAAVGKTVAPEALALPRPDPEVVASAKRRTFTAEYKLRILAEADAAAAQPVPSAPCSAAKASIPRAWSPGVASGRPAFSRV
jgi:hypothetical protein